MSTISIKRPSLPALEEGRKLTLIDDPIATELFGAELAGADKKPNVLKGVVEGFCGLRSREESRLQEIFPGEYSTRFSSPSDGGIKPEAV